MTMILDWRDSTVARIRALEAYPMCSPSGLVEELHSGLLSTFLDAGFHEVSLPTKRRAIVLVECDELEGRGR